MIDRFKIESLVKEFIKGTGLFLVAVKVSTSNKITVLADTMKGITIDECVELHRYLERNIDRNVEDYELQVSSPGLDMPFGVIEQYYKNEGEQIMVVDIDDNRFSGKLKNVTEGGFDLEAETRIKGKLGESEDISFNFDQVKSAKTIVTIR
ncbi:MAG: ribosome assembly cofactor RimP [Bacteroidales bacterium]|nr:ribosome assembly cofactor RimP [Bacteroidales bacterium]